MDWFERLTGFKEADYRSTQERLRVENGKLRSTANSQSYGVGHLELASLRELRSRRAMMPGKLKLSLLTADVRELHRKEENSGAVFQVASQFNLLEMTGPSVTPEHGVTIYEYDRTQGPACAIAAGAATIYRNYFASVEGQTGQTADRQLDGLADVGHALAKETGLPASELWQMQNGYALATERGLDAIGRALATLAENEIDQLRNQLRVGVHTDVEITDSPATSGQRVTQVFCSALPIGYSRLGAAKWELFARLILEAAYEATLRCAAESASRTGCQKVFLTLIGAGAFGNPQSWVLDAAERALRIFRDTNLDVTIVSYGSPTPDLIRLATAFEALP